MKKDELIERINLVNLFDLDIQSVSLFPKETNVILREEDNPEIRGQFNFHDQPDLKGWSSATVKFKYYNLIINLIS
jgi:hypothetical protein